MAKLDKNLTNVIDFLKYKKRHEVIIPNAFVKDYQHINLWNKIYGGNKKYVPAKAPYINIKDAPIALANKMVQDVMMDFDIPREETVAYIKAVKQSMLLYAGAINRTEFNLQEAARMVRVICMAIEFRRMMNINDHLNVNYTDLLLASERYNLIYSQQD